MEQYTVIFHRADYDGEFCRETARKFLPPNTVFIGWDFGDPPIDDKLLAAPNLIIMDLPVDQPFGLLFKDGWICRGGEQVQPIDRWSSGNITWIDHHKSAIDSHPASIPGYRIDGVAACRLAWQWFSHQAEWLRAAPGQYELPGKKMFTGRVVDEPLAVRLAGEYDVWDHVASNFADVSFQFGLDSQEIIPWTQILDHGFGAENVTGSIVADGRAAERCYAKRDADVMRSRSFIVEWRGLKFLALTVARCNSNTFAAKDVPETGHDALMAFYYTGKEWSFSLYHAAHRKEIDLSVIAKSYDGGGHRGACGFRVRNIPFIL